MSTTPARALRRLVTVTVAVAVAALGTFALVQPASAATSTVKVGSVSTGNGTLVTPKVTKSGKAKITSTSHKVTSSGKTVTTTTTQGKTIKVKAGKYTVKTTVKYKVGKKKTYTKSSTVTVKTWNPASMSKAEYDKIKPGMTKAEVKAVVGSSGTRTDYTEYEWDGETVVEERYQWDVTGSNYGFAAVYFTNGVVDEGYYKYYSA